jgi:hypothetical protein
MSRSTKLLPALPAGSPFVTERFSEITNDLERIAAAFPPVCPATVSADAMQKEWKNSRGWIMAAVHCFLLDMTRRVYAVRDIPYADCSAG